MPPSRGKALVESLPKPPPSQPARSSDPFEGAFFAPGAAGQQARQLVRKYRDQGVTLQLVQERSGNYKPLYRAFPHKDGLSTVPILMQGHPDDVKGGRLISSEYEISLRKRSQAKEKEGLSANEGHAQQAHGGKEAQARKKTAKKRRHASPEAH